MAVRLSPRSAERCCAVQAETCEVSEIVAPVLGAILVALSPKPRPMDHDIWVVHLNYEIEGH
jgi:hypothetical protein